MDEVPLPTPAPQSQQQSQGSQQPQQLAPAITPDQAVMPAVQPPMLCPRCHFVVKPEYYFCPNCGAKLTEPPLGTSLVDQLLLYAFSIILPWIAYLAISKWQGIKYLRAPDARAKQIGLIALVLLIASSIVAFWLTTVWIQGYVQQSLNDVNNLGTGTGF